MDSSDVIDTQVAPATRRPLPKRLLWGAAFVAIAGALVLGWPWLTAIGAASVLISVLPCIAMCALGLCMNKRPRASCDQKGKK